MKKQDAKLILEIRDFIDDNIYHRHSIGDLCEQFRINREKLQVGFRELVDSTVHSYIVRRRIDNAARRLLETDDSIKEIALDSGYKKQRSFNKTFKSIYQFSPAAYRKLYQPASRSPLWKPTT